MLIEIIIAFLGIVVGLLLARFTKEELKQGKKYFIWIKRIILFVMVIILIYLSWTKIFFIKEAFGAVIGFFVGLLVAYFFKKEYFYFGLILDMLLYTAPFLLITTLIFLFGLPYGALLFTKKERYKTVLFDLIMFAIPLFFIPLLLGFFSQGNFILNFSPFFFAFAGGALFTLIFKVDKK